MAEKIVVIHRGTRIIHLRPGADGKPRTLLPGHSIETLDDAEAKQLLAYTRDIADAALVVPHNAAKISGMQAELDRLKAENAKLTAKVAATDADDEGKEKGHKGGKGSK